MRNRCQRLGLICADMMPCSLAPQVVDVWKAELRSKNKPKVAASIAHPNENAGLFEERWEEALGREQEVGAHGDEDEDEDESS